MYLQDILRYAGIVLLFVGAVLSVLSAVVFVTRDVRGALRFLRGGAAPSDASASERGETRRAPSLRRSHTVTRETRDSLAEAQGAERVSAGRSAQIQANGPKDTGQDAMETVVQDSGQDALATVMGDDSQDATPTMVGVEPQDGDGKTTDLQAGEQSAPLDAQAKRAQEAEGAPFEVIKGIRIVNAAVTIQVV